MRNHWLRNVSSIVTSALLLNIAFRFSFLSFLAFVFLIPLLFAVLRNRKSVFFYFYLCGFIHYFFSLFWLTSVSKLGFLLLVAYFALFWGLFGWLGKRFFINGSIFAASFLWVVVEYIRSYLILGGFPWLLLGYTQYRNLIFVQSADILGAEFTSFLVIMVNFAIFELLKLPRRKRLFILGISGTGLILLFDLFYGFYRLHQNFPYEGKLTAAIAQINSRNSGDYAYHRSVVEKIINITKNTSQKELIIFPEAAYPFLVSGKYIHPLFSLRHDMIVGALRKEGKKVYNSFFLFDAAQNRVEIYDKNNLVPFGEYVPGGRIFRFISALNSIDNMQAGKEIRLLSYKGTKIGPLVCFEDIFPFFVGAEAKRGANVFVNITDESWFGGRGEMIQHLQAAVFRAIEQRRFFIRAANSGISCVITARGQIRDFLTHYKNVKQEEFFVSSDIFLYSFPTLYSRINDLFVGFSLLIVLLMIIKKGGLYGVKN